MRHDLWESAAVAEAISTSTNQRPSHGMAFLLRHLDRMAETRGPRRLLDLGCGNGRNAAALRGTNLSYYGLDVVFRPLLKARAAGDAEDLHPIQASMTDGLPFSPGMFRVVTAFTSIENVVADRQLRDLAGEVHRVLCRDGLLYVYFLTTEDGYYRPLIQPSSDGRSLTHDPATGLRQRVYRLDELCELFLPWFELLDSEQFTFQDTRSHAVHERRLAAGLWRRH